MKYKYKPKNKEELVKTIKKEIYEVQGTPDNPNWQADLNCIDTSLITDMSYLFSYISKLDKFNGDISQWNVSSVKNMINMFLKSQFNGNISNWDVSNVENMQGMFAHSKFNRNISKWNVSNVKDMGYMFAHSEFNKSLSEWKINKIRDMSYMFWNSKFNQDIGNWDISNIDNIFNILKNISISPKYPKLPDKVKYPKTITNIFNYVTYNPNSREITKDQAVNILIKWLNNKQKGYIKKKLDKKTIKQLLTNDFLDIYKNIDNKDKFLNLLKENRIDIDFYKEM